MSLPSGVHAPRVPSVGSPAVVHAVLRDARRQLDRLRVHHFELTKRFMGVDGGRLFSVDLFLFGVMSRSYSLVDGFIDAFDKWNLIVAAPLLRMQLDSLVRVHYLASTSEGADEVAEYVLAGGEFRRRRDTEGKVLTDARLIKLAEGTHPWVQDVYDATSGWVHLSPVHLHLPVRLVQEEGTEPKATKQGFVASIPVRAEDVPLQSLGELLGAMTRATAELFGHVEGWEARKGLPSSQIRPLR